jgi:formate hydrogenlyase transcriptional activator
VQDEVQSESRLDEVIGESPALKRVLALAKSAAASDDPMLILGETGSGKELIARAVHRLSARRNNSFIKVNCATTGPGLLEVEIFGHKKGALKGTNGQKTGRLELAHKGTLFLNEIAEFPLDLQPKLLRVLERREFERQGGTRAIPVNVRWIAATRYDLRQMVAERRFRGDLYEQLKGLRIEVPSLRERRDDIPLLVRYFVQGFARRMNKHIDTVPVEIMRALQNRDWPGNVRELEHFIERSIRLTEGSTLRDPRAER